MANSFWKAFLQRNFLAASDNDLRASVSTMRYVQVERCVTFRLNDVLRSG